jgi:MFS family permease
MAGFTLIWAGQFISFIGTGMTRFATTVWAYQITGEATALALVGFFGFAPLIIMTPFAGALVDRWNRKLVTALADLGAGLTTVGLLILFLMGNLQVWHLMVAGAVAGIFESFQFPAFSASMSLMLKKKEYGRANGMLSLAESASGIVAPLLAGILLPLVGLGGIMAVDIVTFSLAVLAVFLVFIPQPPRTASGEEAQGNLLREAVYGFKYIWKRASLLGLQSLFFFSNFFFTMSTILLPAYILARTSNNTALLGTVQAAMGVGGVAGGLLMSTWGGPQRRIHGLLIGFMGSSLLGQALMGTGQSLPVWLTAGFLMLAFLPFINGSNQAIWQAKVAPDVQGRVFSARRLIAQVTIPLGMLAGGLLADNVFEPLMMAPTGGLPLALTGLVGSGPGAGMGLLFVITGVLGTIVGAAGYLVPPIRYAEDLLPDHIAVHGEFADGAAPSTPSPVLEPASDAAPIQPLP